MDKRSMKTKNITRAVNAVFGTGDPGDLRRLIWLIEKLVLPFGAETYTREGLEKAVAAALMAKGHKIIDEPYVPPEGHPQPVEDVKTVHGPVSEEPGMEAYKYHIASNGEEYFFLGHP